MKIYFKILFFILVLILTSCAEIFLPIAALNSTQNPSQGTLPSSDVGSIDPVPLVNVDAYEDKFYQIDLSKINNITGVSGSNIPSWLTYNSITKKLEGIPDNNQNLNNFYFNVLKSGSAAPISYGPYQISIHGDPLKKYQWHLKNTGQTNFAVNAGSVGEDIHQSQTIQDNITGRGIKIAVSDSGVEIAHEDLAANIISGASKNYNLSAPYIGDPTPTSTTDYRVYHGTAVAGIISAVGWNNIGGRGVAPNSKIAGLNFLNATQTTAAQMDQASGNFDIFNYSYGSAQIKQDSSILSYTQQLRYGVTTQRNLKGSIYIKSAGNDFDGDYPYLQSNPDLSCFNNGVGPDGNKHCKYFGNSNLDIDNTLSEIIIVGALNAKGKSASYSSPGSNIWISAPGGESGDTDPAIMTTDLQGCSKGKSSSLVLPNNSFENSTLLNSNCKYTSVMNGTSSAAPVTSGAVALILEANPNLTWRDVKYILAATATKIDATATATTHPYGYDLAGHTYQNGWTQNAAGFWFHNWYGFGRVHVDNAVAMAKTYTGILNPIQFTNDVNNNWYYSSGAISQAIPDNSSTGTSSMINVRHNFIIEAVQVQFSTTHQWLTDLGVELTSPSGTKSILLNINSGMIRNNLLAFDAQLLSNSFFGEESAGNWTLKVIDGAAGGSGNLTNWKINITGHKKPNSTDLIAPNPISNIIHASAYNSSSNSPAISWTASSSSDVLRYEVSVGTSAGSANILPWSPVGLNLNYQATGLFLTVGQTYFVNVKAVDTSENESSIISSTGWLYTTSAAPTIIISAPTLTKLSSALSADFNINYSGANNITLNTADIILNQTGVSCTKSVSGSGSTTRVFNLSNCTGNGTISFSISANTATNSVGLFAAASNQSSTITIDNIAPTITGLVNDSTATRSKNWSWGCNESPCTFRYAIDTASSTNPAGTFGSIMTASQTSGSGIYYLHVQAQDSVGNISSVVHVSAVLDNTAPVLTGLSNDSVWTTSKTWNWSCNKIPCTYRFVIDANATTAPSGAYGSISTTSQIAGTGTYYLHVQAKDSLGNENSVSHFSFKLDNNPPSSPASANLSALYSQSLTTSPILNFGIATDSESGILKYQARVVQVSNSNVIKNWTDVTTGSVLSGMALVTNSQYRVEVSALDNLNNRSISTNATWLVDATSPTSPNAGITIGSTPFDLNSSPTVTWNIPTDTGGSGISFYEVRLKKSSDNSIIQDWTTKLRGDSFSGLNLIDDTNYYFEIRATDNANNVSAVATSVSWRTNYHYYQKVSVGSTFVCGITLLGSVKCWGNYPGGSSLIPKLIVGLESGVTHIDSGYDHVCAIQSGGVKCWGANAFGQLGNGNTIATTSLATPLSTGVTSISSGNYFSCAVKTNQTYCWGWGIVGQLGQAANSDSASPVLVSGTNSNVSYVISGAGNSCHKMNGVLQCWGNNTEYEFGNGSTISRNYPVNIGGSVVDMFSASSGISTTSQALRWGPGGFNGLEGGYSSTGIQTVITGFSAATSSKVYNGINYACILKTDSSLSCIGMNESGQIGIGTSVTSYSAAQVVFTSGIVDGSSSKYGGGGIVCAINSANRLMCWGANSNGAVGDKTTTNKTSPTYVLNN